MATVEERAGVATVGRRFWRTRALPGWPMALPALMTVLRKCDTMLCLHTPAGRYRLSAACMDDAPEVGRPTRGGGVDGRCWSLSGRTATQRQSG